MGSLTSNFNISEFVCPCGQCAGGTMSPAFMTMLQALRTFMGQPLGITSGFRCAAHNAAVGGEPDSLHLLGRAADIACPSSEFRYRLVKAAGEHDFRGIGIAATYVHLDNRNFPAMWTYYKAKGPKAAHVDAPRAVLPYYAGEPVGCQ